MDPNPRTIQQVVGDNLRRLREERGVSQDDVARAAQMLGAAWRQSTVGDVEQLRRVPTVETLLVLAAALTALDDEAPVSPVDLLDFDGSVEISQGAFLPGEAVQKMLAGAPGFLLHAPVEQGTTYKAALDRYFRQPPVPRAAANAVRDRYVLADERAAQRLGIDDEQAQELMARIWGESLSSRSSRLAVGPAGEKPSAQRKGIVTRRLTQELEEGLELMRALDVVGERGAAEEVLEPEQWAALARELARRRAGSTGRAVLGHLGLDGAAAHFASERSVVEGIPWVSEELLERLEEAADHGIDQ